MFPCNWNPSAFFKSSLKARALFLSTGQCREGHTGKSRLCTGGDGGPHCPDVKLDSGFDRIVKATDTWTLQCQFAFKLPFRARHHTPRLVGCSFSSFFPGAGVGCSGICFPSLWMLFFEKQACLRMEATSTPDSGTHGQAVKVPELPGRLRPRPAPLRPHVRVQTQPGHFLRAEQPQAHGFPTQNLSFFICRMEVMACPPCRGLGRVAMDMGQGRGTSCFLQFPAEALWAWAGVQDSSQTLLSVVMSMELGTGIPPHSLDIGVGGSRLWGTSSVISTTPCVRTVQQQMFSGTCQPGCKPPSPPHLMWASWPSLWYRGQIPLLREGTEALRVGARRSRPLGLTGAEPALEPGCWALMSDSLPWTMRTGL